jgi:beta-lactamase class A
MTQQLHKYIPTVGALLIGLFLGIFGAQIFTSSSEDTESSVRGNPSEKNLREQHTDFKFISPLLTCGVEGELTSTKEVRTLKANVEALIKQKQNTKIITNAGVYVRELNDGVWFGINETESFTPGSLLKVPLALSLLQKMEDDPEFGRDSVEYAGGAPDIAQVYPPLETVEAGSTYTFDQLLRLSIMYSDNKATLILSQLIDRQLLNNSYSDLGIDIPSDGDSYTMSVRTYASFFRILYNGTYLTHENSEYLLSLLAQSTFKEGIVTGVPPDVVVAHKFGERERDESSLVQLHDCGIIYAKDNPYILCVMLRGKKMESLAPVIADISRTVYEGLDHKK